ncbi:MAG: hypothetical protein IKP53_08290 [Candidatus Methanomethylophilaceae archaeon]|nr:hypothetical protein [Candidatus Methanomethylophilaceae archaeon]
MKKSTVLKVPVTGRLSVQIQDDETVRIEVSDGLSTAATEISRGLAWELADTLVDYPWGAASVVIGKGKGIKVSTCEGDMILSIRGVEITLDDDLTDRVAVAVDPFPYPDGPPKASKNRAPARKTPAGRAAPRRKAATAKRKAPAKRRAKGARR